MNNPEAEELSQRDDRKRESGPDREKKQRLEQALEELEQIQKTRDRIGKGSGSSQ